MVPVPEIVVRRWGELSHLVGEGRAAWDELLEELVRRYNGPDRHYHNIAHIAGLLALSEENAEHLQDRAVVDVAIYFHDAIYDTASKGNEADSAALAHDRLTALDVERSLIERVARYIEATDHSGSTRTCDNDLNHLLDFDLATLAGTTPEYCTYAGAIRREYTSAPDGLYRMGRRTVLETFLTREHIYRVPRLAALWEARARANISSEIVELKRGSG